MVIPQLGQLYHWKYKVLVNYYELYTHDYYSITITYLVNCNRVQEVGGVFVIFIIADGLVNITRSKDIKVPYICTIITLCTCARGKAISLCVYCHCCCCCPHDNCQFG